MFRTRSLVLLASLSPATGSALAQCDLGYWEAALDHDTSGFDPAPQTGTFNAVHMSLVPKGPHRGSVLVWDYESDQPAPAWGQRWSLMDVSVPDAYVFHNFMLTLPEDGGDLFCAGFAHTPDGDLFVAGGTSQYNLDGADYVGGKLVYVYRADTGPFGEWVRADDLAFDRWYPTVTQIANGTMLVLGGKSSDAHGSRNDYEAYDPYSHSWETDARGVRLFAGPESPAGALLIYPRIHQLTSRHQFYSGENGWSARMDHVSAPGVWTPTAPNSLTKRHDGAALLLPWGDGRLVATVGGAGHDGEIHIGPSERFESCWASAPGAPDWDWTPQVPMNQGREQLNVVILPDASLVAIGGLVPGPGGDPEPTVVPERYTLEDDQWSEMAAGDTPRDYHSTAVLLPDGRVLTGGGEGRTRDYQVYVPPYIACAAERPVIVSAPETLQYDSGLLAHHALEFAPMSNGDTVEKIVLLKPGSTTHHSDMDMRYVELRQSPAWSLNQLSFLAPRDSAEAPRGYYMMFLVSADGIPSVAHWLKIE